MHDQLRGRVWSGLEKSICIWNAKVTFIGNFQENSQKFLQTGELVKEITERIRAKIYSIVLADDKVWTAADDETISIWDPLVNEEFSKNFPNFLKQSFQLLKKIDAGTGSIYGLTSFGNFVWSCGWDMNIYLWEQTVTFFSI